MREKLLNMPQNLFSTHPARWNTILNGIHLLKRERCLVIQNGFDEEVFDEIEKAVADEKK